jgi:hypothetical protein
LCSKISGCVLPFFALACKPYLFPPIDITCYSIHPISAPRKSHYNEQNQDLNKTREVNGKVEITVFDIKNV